MMKTTKTLSIVLGGALLAFAFMASADSPRPHRNDVVIGAPAGYTYNASWTTDITQDGGKKSGAIALNNGSEETDFAYYAFTGWWDQSLSDVTKIRASFKAGEETVNDGGSPRISLEVDIDGIDDGADGIADASNGVIYLDPAHCGDAVDRGWTFSNFTDDLTNCSIFDSRGVQYTSDGVTSAWDMLVADPYYVDATVWFAYLIQDATTGTNYVDRIMLDSAFLTKQP